MQVIENLSVKEKLYIEKLENGLTSIIFDSIILQKQPMQVSLYLSKRAKKIIDEVVIEEKPDIVIGDMIRTSEYIKNINSYTICDLDDRISLRYQRQLEKDINEINPYGAFLNTIPKCFQKIMLLKPLKVFVIKNEIKLLKKYEISMGEKCDCTIFVAKKEADNFNRELGEKKAVAIPIGVDTNYFSYNEESIDDNNIGFLGAMSVAHNANAVKYFVDKILPHVLDVVPDAKFLVIGGGVSEELKKMESKNIEFTEWVDDVRDFLNKCKVFVCPMQFGSGIKTKNLEAMSMGLPVVTTDIGAENINAENGKEWIIENNEEKFADAICSLLKDKEKRQTIGKNGRKYIENNWTWDVAKNEFEILLG